MSGAPRAAPEVHGGEDGPALLLRVTRACSQRCPFCFVPRGEGPVPDAELERALDAAAAAMGPRRELTLSGGEPAGDPRLPALVASARRRGFRRFVLQTNAVYLARPGLLERLTALGVRSFLVSLHAPDPALYDRVTASRRQFPLAVRGLARLLRAPGCDVTVNVVVNAANAADLPRIPGLVARLRAGARGRRPGFYFSMLNEAGHQTAPDWGVSLADAGPSLRRAVARCRALGFPVARSAGESSFPPCAFDEPARHAPRAPLPQERVRRGAPDAGGPAVGRSKADACASCRYDARCLGVPAAYARLFGLGALGLTGRPRG